MGTRSPSRRPTCATAGYSARRTACTVPALQRAMHRTVRLQEAARMDRSLADAAVAAPGMVVGGIDGRSSRASMTRGYNWGPGRCMGSGVGVS